LERVHRFVVSLVATPRRRVALALLAFAALAVMGSLAATLREMHLPGTRSATVTDVASATADPGDVLEIVSSWDLWDDQREVRYKSSEYVATLWLALDTLVFAPALALIVAGIARARRDLVRGYGAVVASVALLRPGMHGRVRNLAALVQLLDLAWRFAFVYLLFDVLENLATWIVVLDDAPTWTPSLVRGFTIAKLAALALAAVPIVLSYAALFPPARAALRRFVDTVVVLRIQVVGVVGAVGVLLYLPGNVRPQLADLVRDWDVQRAVAAVAGAVLLSTVLLLSGRRAVDAAATPVSPQPPYGPKRLALQSLAALGLILFGALGAKQVPGLRSGVLPLAFGILLAVWCLLALPRALWDLTPRRRRVRARPGVVTLLVFLPPYALYLTWLRAEVTIAVSWLVALLAVAGAGVLVGLWLVLHHPWPPARVGPVVNGVAIGAALVLALLLFAPWPEQLRDVGYNGGAVALALGAFALVVASLAGIALLLRLPPRGPLAFARLRWYPLLTTILVLFVFTSQLDTTPGFHRARIEPRDSELASNDRRPRDAYTLTQAFDAWKAASGGDTERAGGWRPLVIVVASGGGARAAYWTLLTFECLFRAHDEDASAACEGDAEDEQAVFAGSGISGGSVGLTVFSANAGDTSRSIDPDDVFDQSYVDAVFANLVAVDLPNAFVHAPGWSDRAAALEDAWKAEVTGLDAKLFGTTPDADPGAAPQQRGGRGRLPGERVAALTAPRHAGRRDGRERDDDHDRGERRHDDVGAGPARRSAARTGRAVPVAAPARPAVRAPVGRRHHVDARPARHRVRRPGPGARDRGAAVRTLPVRVAVGGGAVLPRGGPLHLPRRRRDRRLLGCEHRGGGAARAVAEGARPQPRRSTGGPVRAARRAAARQRVRGRPGGRPPVAAA
jgi:hypothetical protein